MSFFLLTLVLFGTYFGCVTKGDKLVNERVSKDALPLSTSNSLFYDYSRQFFFYITPAESNQTSDHFSMIKVNSFFDIAKNCFCPKIHSKNEN